jgi:hypothetical protein
MSCAVIPCAAERPHVNDSIAMAAKSNFLFMGTTNFIGIKPKEYFVKDTLNSHWSVHTRGAQPACCRSLASSVEMLL